MRRSRFYTPEPLSSTDTVTLTGSVFHYLKRVLRLSMGDPVTLFNGDGRDYLGEVSEIQSRQVLVRLVGNEIAGNESKLKLTLVQAISRGERMDYTLQKSTELGVFSIQPLTSKRVEVRLNETRLARRMAHWQGVVVSACEQSGRATVPEVKKPLTLTQWLSAPDGSQRMVLDPVAERTLSSLATLSGSMSVLVGPEGGFSTEEMEQIRSTDVQSFSLGPRVLRTETAGPASIAVLQAMGGDF